MLTYEWRPSFRGDSEVAELLDAATTFDAEQGFSPVPPDAEDEPAKILNVWELAARITPHVGARSDEQQRVAAFLRVQTTSGREAGVELVVHPEFRSLGVGTLLVETIGLDTAGSAGWAGTDAHSLRIWSRGSHPAAERMAMRFQAATDRTMWRLIRPISQRNPPPAELPPNVYVGHVESTDQRDTVMRLAGEWPGALRLDTPGELLVAKQADTIVGYAQLSIAGSLGTVQTIEVAPGVARRPVAHALLASVLRSVSEAGAAEAEILVDAVADTLVQTCRVLGFRHDQTDVCYRFA